MSLKMFLLVMLGGALGSGARAGLSELVAWRFGTGFPLGTLAVNILGSLVIGLIAGLTMPEGRWLVSAELRVFMLLGVLGGFTTFSSFSLQTVELMQAGRTLSALGYVLLSVILCVVCAWLGLLAAGHFNAR